MIELPNYVDVNNNEHKPLTLYTYIKPTCNFFTLTLTSNQLVNNFNVLHSFSFVWRQRLRPGPVCLEVSKIAMTKLPLLYGVGDRVVR
jgi:hypothetical protein